MKIIGDRSLSVINLGAAACAATAATDIMTTGGCGLAIFAAGGALMNAVHEEHRKDFDKYLKKAQKAVEEEIAKNSFITGEATQDDINATYDGLLPAIQAVNPSVKDFGNWGLNPDKVAAALVDLFVDNHIAPFASNKACQKIARVIIHAAFSALKTDKKFWQRGDIWIAEALFEKLEEINQGIGLIRKDIRELSDKLSDSPRVSHHANVGAIKMIDRSFIQDTLATGYKRSFTASNFFLGKRTEDYQWYGIIKEWDVSREIYPKIKKKVIDSFTVNSRNNVVALITGAGGAGKSTILRRLATDCVDENFTVLWIDDTNIVEFFEGRQYAALPKDVQYLFIFEDWYRIKQQLTAQEAFRLLSNLNNLSNSRICVGDRNQDPSVISMLQGGAEFGLFHLHSDETPSVISKVLKHFPNVERKIVGELEDLKTGSVYSTIFALSRLELSGDFATIELGEIDTHFLEIVTSDLKKLADFHLGAARLLVFWARLYIDRKIGISPKIISHLWRSLDAENREHLPEQANAILNLYISHEKNSDDFYLFNQDILAEMGLSKPIFGPGLNERDFLFDKNIKQKILGALIDTADQTAAKTLQAVILEIGINNFNFKELYELSMEAYANGIYGWHLVVFLSHPDCPKGDDSIVKMLEGLFEEYLKNAFILPGHTLLEMYKYLPSIVASETMALKVLQHDEITSLPHEIVVRAFGQTGNDEDKAKAAFNILTHEKITTLTHYIVVQAFLQPGNDKEKEKAASKILRHEEIISLPHDIVVQAFRQPGNDKDKERAALNILTHEKMTSLTHDIVVQVFLQAGNEKVKKKAASKILKHDDITLLPHDTVVQAFRQPGNELDKVEAALQILNYENITSLTHHFVVQAFLQEGNEKKKENVALKILKDDELTSLPHDFVVQAFRQSGNETEKEQAALKILKHKNITSLHHQIVVQAFRQIGNDIDKEKAIEQLQDKWGWKEIPMHWFLPILFYFNERDLNSEKGRNFKNYIDNLINAYVANKKKGVAINPRMYGTYSMALSFPLVEIDSWKRTTDFILSNWRRQNRMHVTQIIKAYKNTPVEILSVCRDILDNWKSECDKTHNKLFSSDKVVGGCLKLALRHPLLDEKAKTVASEMIASHESGFTLPEDFKEIAMEILENPH